MRSDPEPLDAARNIVTQRAMMFADAHRPNLPEALEMERRVLWIGLEELEVLVGDCSDAGWQRIVKRPEPDRSRVLQRGRVFCALWSAIDSSMRRSSFPAAASASI